MRMTMLPRSGWSAFSRNELSIGHPELSVRVVVLASRSTNVGLRRTP